MTEELLRNIRKQLAVQLENQPAINSDRFFVGDSDTVTAGTSLTVTFTLNPLFVTRLVEGYCDEVPGLSYLWVINGVVTPLNLVKYHLGKVVHDDIKLVISNPTGSDEEVGYYVQGWGDLKE